MSGRLDPENLISLPVGLAAWFWLTNKSTNRPTENGFVVPEITPEAEHELPDWGVAMKWILY